MGIISNLISSILNKATITGKTKLTSNTYHIQLQGEILKQSNYVPGNFIRVFVGKDKDLAFKDNLRSYSVWKLDKISGTLDMAVCIHANGPGSSWVKECQIGDTISFSWKKGDFIVDDSADDYLFIGDLSALGHLYEINRNLPTGKHIQSIIFNADKADFFPDVDGTYPFQFYPFADDAGEQVIKQIQGLINNLSFLSLNSMVYVGGDSRVCVKVNHYFRKDLKWDSRRIKTKPFWNPLKTGLE